MLKNKTHSSRAMPARSATAAAALAVAALLAACGGGGGDDTTSTGNTGGNGTQTGKFIDAAVQGLDYYVGGVKAGTTNAAGEFTYTAGQAVTFKVGNVTIGTTGTGDLSTVTPADLTANAASMSNILVLLQSLDADANPDNGIAIPADRAAALTTLVNLAAVGSTLASVATDLPGLALVSASAAGNHFVSGAAAAAPNATVSGALDALVGYWHFQCDGEGYSVVTEARKAAANKLYFARNIGRQYANANCTGTYTLRPEFGGANQMDYATLLGAVNNSDGGTTITMSQNVDETTTATETFSITLAANRASFTDHSARPFPGAIVKVSAFAFP